MNILITGGCGYIGSRLVNDFLNQGYNVTVIDTLWFGNFLIPSKNLKIIECDIRNIKINFFKNIKTVIHLANIANDPAVALNEKLSWDVNVYASKLICDFSIKSGVKQIIYASSGSVYGIKKEKKVTEDLDLVPISIYNKTKMIAERVFLSYQKNIKIHCIRPATVCGISPRMRLDVSVNLLTFQALKNKKIKVFGGSQIRPNINIKDMTRVIFHFIKNNNLTSGVYNAGFENISILKLAKKIQKRIPSNIEITKTNDNRSYRLDSSKLINTGFKKLYSVDDAIEDLINLYNNGKLKNFLSNYNVKWMNKFKLK